MVHLNTQKDIRRKTLIKSFRLFINSRHGCRPDRPALNCLLLRCSCCSSVILFMISGAKVMDDSAESSLLYAARNGDIEKVKSLITAQKQNRLSLDLNCIGTYI